MEYTTNPHKRSASNGRASCLPSARRAATERLPSKIARWQALGGRSAENLLGHCSPSARHGVAVGLRECSFREAKPCGIPFVRVLQTGMSSFQASEQLGTEGCSIIQVLLL